MKYLHRENIPGKTWAQLQAEGANVDYICTENQSEPGYTECSDDIQAWESYFISEGYIGYPYSIQYSGRFYLSRGRWYGPNSSYGTAYHNFNSSYKTTSPTNFPTPMPYTATGLKVSKDGFLKKVIMVGRFNQSGMKVHFAINSQMKSDNSTSVENRNIYHDTSHKIYTQKNKNYIIELDVNKPVFNGEILTLMANRGDTGSNNTKYLYTNVEFIFE